MPKPVLQAMVVADHVYQDHFTGKFIIAGTFGAIHRFPPAESPAGSPPEPTEQPRIVTGPIMRVGSPYLYLALVEVHGVVPLQIKFFDLHDSTIKFMADFTVRSRDPVAVGEYCLPLPPIPVDKPGSFSLDLFYENELLGSWRITIKIGSQQTREDD